MPGPTRIVLDRPVVLTARGAYPGPANPFERENFSVPLLLVAHARSLDALDGEAREEAEILLSLGYSPFADVWLTAGKHRFDERLPQVQALPDASGQDRDTLTVEIADGARQSGLRTVIRDWQRWVARARERYEGDLVDRAVDAYAGALFTVAADRHLFVTAEPTLLAERAAGSPGEANVVTVREAIALVGLLMRQRGRCDLFYDESGPFERSDAARLHATLADLLVMPTHELDDAIAAAGQSSDATYDLIFAAEDRISDLLVSRDEVRVASLLPHGGAMLSTALYHLRAAVQTAYALLDSVAVLACEQLHIELDPLTVTFRRPDFRQALAAAGGPSLADVVNTQRYLALAFFVSKLRGPAGHGRGLHGVTDPTAPEVVSRLRLTDAQAEKLKGLYGQRKESAQSWGVAAGRTDAVDLDVLCDRLARTVVDEFVHTAGALAADLRRKHPGSSQSVVAWQALDDRAQRARAALTDVERGELERREREDAASQAAYDRKVLRHLALYAGLADWPLLQQLIAERTDSDEGTS